MRCTTSHCWCSLRSLLCDSDSEDSSSSMSMCLEDEHGGASKRTSSSGFTHNDTDWFYLFSTSESTIQHHREPSYKRDRRQRPRRGRHIIVPQRDDPVTTHLFRTGNKGAKRDQTRRGGGAGRGQEPEEPEPRHGPTDRRDCHGPVTGRQQRTGSTREARASRAGHQSGTKGGQRAVG